MRVDRKSGLGPWTQHGLYSIDTAWGELSVDLLRYIGEMLFELFSMLCSVIIIINILFITHTCTNAYNLYIYVFYIPKNVEHVIYRCTKGFA